MKSDEKKVDILDLAKMTERQLLKVFAHYTARQMKLTLKALGIKGLSKLTKDQLIDLLYDNIEKIRNGELNQEAIAAWEEKNISYFVDEDDKEMADNINKAMSEFKSLPEWVSYNIVEFTLEMNEWYKGKKNIETEEIETLSYGIDDYMY